MLIKIEKPQVSATAAEALRYKKLREKLALFHQITLCFLCPGNSGGVAHILICEDELLGAQVGFCFAEFEFVQKWDWL